MSHREYPSKDGVGEFINTTGLKECNYYLHGVCISFLFNRFREDSAKCLPACNSFNFHVETLHVRYTEYYVRPSKTQLIQYMKEEDDYQEKLRRQLQLNGSDIEIVSAIIHISEIANELHEEAPTYPLTYLLSDVGGALGLCLGLSIWTIMHSLYKCKLHVLPV